MRQDQRAWEELLRESESRLRTLLFFRLKSDHRSHMDPDDLLQEVWVQAAIKIDQFEYQGKGSLQRWLAGILRNKVLQASEKAGRSPFPESSLAPSESAELGGFFDALSQTQPAVSSNAQRRESEKIVRDILQDLAPKHRDTLLLFLYEGMTGPEAAAELQLSVSGFYQRFHKALELVSARLPKEAM
jgi:RNA polymerase sigma factor (sigma-70 family)